MSPEVTYYRDGVSASGYEGIAICYFDAANGYEGNPWHCQPNCAEPGKTDRRI
jgi:hypothetical protein